MRLIKRNPIRGIIGFCRFLIIRIWYYQSLKARGFSIIDRNVSVFVLWGGKIELGNRVFIGKEVEVQARRGTVSIGDGVTINHYSRIIAFERIKIGARCAIAQFVSILDHNHAYCEKGEMEKYVTAPIIIGDDVWIGDKVTIMAGVSIGDGAIIGAGAVVTKDIPSGGLAVGIPARVVRYANQNNMNKN